MKFEIKNRTGAVQAIESGANLRGADLRGANLRGADLRGADLGGADLRGANLGGADLEGANLRGANLEGANLRGAYFRGANLEGACLEGADLRGANLEGANLRGANLGGLKLIARAIRSDGWEYIAWTSIFGGMVIRAGCREWIGDDAIAQAREHCATVTSGTYSAEALGICDYIEACATRENVQPSLRFERTRVSA